MGTPRPAHPYLPTSRRGAGRLGRARLLVLALFLTLAAPVLAGCGGSGVEGGRREVHPEVEALYDEAIRTALAEVPDSELTGLVLRHDEGGAPVWHSTVVTPDGTEHTVRIAATTGDLMASPSPAGPAPERAEVLLEKAKLLPEEAARKVTVPDYGKVTRIALGETEGRTVWFVEVTTLEEDHVRRTAVDAVTGGTVDSTPLPRDAGRHEPQ